MFVLYAFTSIFMYMSLFMSLCVFIYVCISEEGAWTFSPMFQQPRVPHHQKFSYGPPSVETVKTFTASCCVFDACVQSVLGRGDVVNIIGTIYRYHYRASIHYVNQVACFQHALHVRSCFGGHFVQTSLKSNMQTTPSSSSSASAIAADDTTTSG